MIDHEKSDQESFNAINDVLVRIEQKLNPVYETYTSATTLGQWIMRTFVFISVLVGVILGFKSLLK